MIHIEKILCPVDFSDCSQQAVRYAVAFAKKFKARLLLLHVLDMRIYALLDPYAGPDWTIQDIEREAAVNLDKMILSADRESVDIEKFIREGTPYAEIVTFAGNEEIDLIVIGTHGRTGLKHILVGSVAERVVRRAPCPVLTVRPHERDFVTP